MSCPNRAWIGRCSAPDPSDSPTDRRCPNCRPPDSMLQPSPSMPGKWLHFANVSSRTSFECERREPCPRSLLAPPTRFTDEPVTKEATAGAAKRCASGRSPREDDSDAPTNPGIQPSSDGDYSRPVTLRTSSSVVWPRRALSSPLSRSVRIPNSIDLRRSSEAWERATIMSRIASFSGSTS